MKAACLDHLAFALVLDSIAAGPEADEYVHLLCLPEADVPAESRTPRRAGRPVAGLPPARG